VRCNDILRPSVSVPVIFSGFAPIPHDPPHLFQYRKKERNARRPSPQPWLHSARFTCSQSIGVRHVRCTYGTSGSAAAASSWQDGQDLQYCLWRASPSPKSSPSVCSRIPPDVVAYLDVAWPQGTPESWARRSLKIAAQEFQGPLSQYVVGCSMGWGKLGETGWVIVGTRN